MFCSLDQVLFFTVFIKNRLFCSCFSVEFLVFQVVSRKLEIRFQKKLFSFNLGSFWFGFHKVFSVMERGISKLRWLA